MLHAWGFQVMGTSTNLRVSAVIPQVQPEVSGAGLNVELLVMRLSKSLPPNSALLREQWSR